MRLSGGDAAVSKTPPTGALSKSILLDASGVLSSAEHIRPPPKLPGMPNLAGSNDTETQKEKSSNVRTLVRALGLIFNRGVITWQ